MPTGRDRSAGVRFRSLGIHVWVLGIALVACGAPGTGGFGPTPAFEEIRPASILVVTAPGGGGDPALLRRLVEERLRHQGYRVGRPADATLTVRVDGWREQARLRGGSQGLVALSAQLRQGGDGPLLWTGRGREVEEAEDDDREQGLLENLFDAAVGTALEPVLGGLDRLAEEAVFDLLRDLPRAPSPAGPQKR